MKEEAYTALMEQVLTFSEKFKYLDKATESLCKTLAKTSITNQEFGEVVKLYNTTGSMYLKSLELLDKILSRFPLEVTPDELELLEEYRMLSESERYMYKSKLKHRI